MEANGRPGELEILAYGDGLLDAEPAAKAAFEARLRAYPELAARAHAYRSQTDALRAVYRGGESEPIPEHMLAVLDRPPPYTGRKVLAAAAVVLLTVSGSGVGWMLGRSDPASDVFAKEFVQRSYEQFVAVTAGSSEASQVEPLRWLSKRISLSLRTPDLSHEGYSLIDKRTLGDANGQSVRLTYAAPDGRKFSLFLRPRWEGGSAVLRVERERDVSIAYWLEGPLVSAIASHMPEDETRAIAQAVRGALLHQNETGPVVETEQSVAGGMGAELAGGETGLPAEDLPTRPEIDELKVIPN